MSVAVTDNTKKVTTLRLIEMKQRGEKISMLTAYDYSMAKLIDEAGMDVILVGDSASNVMAGNATTLPITLDQMIYHGRSVVNAVKRALVVVDMPFGTYQGNPILALESAVRMMKETGADCLYDLLSDLYIIPISENPILRFISFIRLTVFEGLPYSE